MSTVFSRFSTHCKNAIRRAGDVAASVGDSTITAEHLLIGLALEPGSIAEEVLQAARSADAPRTKTFGPTPLQAGPMSLSFTTAAQRALTKAVHCASRYTHTFVGTEHVLQSLLELNEPAIQQWLTRYDIAADQVTNRLTQVLESTSRFPDLSRAVDVLQQRVEHDHSELMTDSTSALAQYAVELTEDAVLAKLSPLIGREQELEQLVHILCRKTKNNPVVLGEAGTGKTALVEGLAQRIAAGSVPLALRNKRIFRPDLAQLISGTSFRGEFEQRLRALIDEITARPDVVIFIDELHTITGAGAASGSLDVASILKPALARGELRLIGATTFDEYRKHIEIDSALERRFQPIQLEPPTLAQAQQMLEGLAPGLEAHHNVQIPPETIRLAVILADRHLPDRQLPDKAIDVLDEAAVTAQLTKPDSKTDRLAALETQVRGIEKQLHDLLEHDAFAEAQMLRRRLQALAKQAQRLSTRTATPANIPIVTPHHLASVISRKTNVAPDVLLRTDDGFSDLANRLSKKIIGQSEAVQTVTDTLIRARAGLHDSRRPHGSFLFVGPTGVGKTELAKTLAEEVYGSSRALIFIDMSELSESHSVSKLIGAPAGYVGFREGSKLTDAIRRRPASVVVFDELEKAHPQVFHLLLQLLDEGRITDASGKVADFSQSTVVMTSNADPEGFRRGRIGFNDIEERGRNGTDAQRTQLRHWLKPELINRIDAVVPFRPLDLKDLTTIAHQQLMELVALLKLQGCTLELSSEISETIARASQTADQGGRTIRRAIQTQLTTPLARLLIEKKPQHIRVGLVRGTILLHPQYGGTRHRTTATHRTRSRAAA